MSELSEEARANLRLALPIVLTQLGTMAMGVVDTAIVGRVGETALASVALGNTLAFAFCIPALGVFMALEPVAAQAIGSGDRVRARAGMRAGLRLAVLLTIPVMLVSFASLALLPLLKVDPTIIPGARAYLIARLPATLPFFLFMAAKTYQQAALRPRHAVEAVIVANVVHAIAAWVAVFGDAGLTRIGLPTMGLPAFGATGAGVATSVSNFLLAAWLLGIRGKIPKDGPDALREGETDDRTLDGTLARALLRVGLPIGLQLGAEIGVFSLVALLMGRIGGRAAAAHQIAINLASLSFMAALGVAQATSVRVGTAVGEGSRARARRGGFVGIGLGISIMALSATTFALAPTVLARAFTHDGNVIALAASLIQIAALFQLADGAQAVAAGALRGAADTRWPLGLNVVVHWGVGLPIGLFLAFRRGLGATGLWLGLTAGLIIISLALITRFAILSRRSFSRV